MENLDLNLVSEGFPRRHQELLILKQEGFIAPKKKEEEERKGSSDSLVKDEEKDACVNWFLSATSRR